MCGVCCRLAALAQNLMKKEGPRNLYVGSLHYNISEQMLKKIFEPFGHVDKLTIQRDENGLSKGYGFIEVSDSFSLTYLVIASLNVLLFALSPQRTEEAKISAPPPPPSNNG